MTTPEPSVSAGTATNPVTEQERAAHERQQAYRPKPSSIPVTCGRVVHVFSTGWSGPRPGLVVRPCRDNLANINVELDGETDRDVIAQIGLAPTGRTLLAIPVFDSMTDEQRVEYAKLATAVPEEHMPVWAEWMPFQMAQSQAPASTKLAERIAGLEEGMLALMNQTTSRANQLADDLEGVKKTQTSGLLESANAAAATPGRRLDAIEARLNEVHEYLTKYTPFVGKDQQPMPADPCRKD